MNERFKIIRPEEQAPRKTFIIKSPVESPERKKTFKIKKTFRILNQSAPGEAGSGAEWSRQDNMSDCGPCLLLNSLHALGLENVPRDIDEMRAEINRARSGSERRELGRMDWFTTDDIEGCFLRRGFSVTGYIGDPDDEHAQESITQAVAKNLERPFDFIYTTFPGLHYRGVVPSEEGNYLLLDSFSDGPQPATAEQVDEFIYSTLSAPKRPTGQREVLGIIRRKETEDGPSNA